MKPRREKKRLWLKLHGPCYRANLSHLPPWLSDLLCRIATGGGFGTRKLHTDSDEQLFSFQRPIVINAIEDIATRADLLSRSLLLTPLAMEDYREEGDFWHAFGQAQPGILGALLDIYCAAMKALPTVHLAVAPRMADFARWACAAAPACGWTAETFLDDYADTRAQAAGMTLEASPVAQVLLSLLADHPRLDGTATFLYGRFKARAEDLDLQAMPRTPRALTDALKRLETTLKAEGIMLHFGQRTKSERLITITRLGAPEAQRSLPPAVDPDVPPAIDEATGLTITAGDDMATVLAFPLTVEGRSTALRQLKARDWWERQQERRSAGR